MLGARMNPRQLQQPLLRPEPTKTSRKPRWTAFSNIGGRKTDRSSSVCDGRAMERPRTLGNPIAIFRTARWHSSNTGMSFGRERRELKLPPPLRPPLRRIPPREFLPMPLVEPLPLPLRANLVASYSLR